MEQNSFINSNNQNTSFVNNNIVDNFNHLSTLKESKQDYISNANNNITSYSEHKEFNTLLLKNVADECNNNNLNINKEELIESISNLFKNKFDEV